MSLLLRILVGFFRFWYDFLIGDAWEIAAGVAAVLLAGLLLLRAGTLPEASLPYVIGVVAIFVLTASVLHEFRKKARQSG